MPASAAASTRPMPFATSTSRPSTVTLTVSTALMPALSCRKLSCRNLGDGVVGVLVDRREDPLERGRPAHRAAAVEVLLELGAELVDVARHRHRRRVPERAEALAEDSVADVEEQVEVVLGRRPLLDRAQDLHHPARPLAARRALAAALV